MRQFLESDPNKITKEMRANSDRKKIGRHLEYVNPNEFNSFIKMDCAQMEDSRGHSVAKISPYEFSGIDAYDKCQ